MIHLTISKFGETLFKGRVQSAHFPTKSGYVGVLVDHETFLTETTQGTLTYMVDDKPIPIRLDQEGLFFMDQNIARVWLV